MVVAIVRCNKIALHRSLMDNSIIYSALTVSTDLPPLKEMASVMKHAVSSSKHQKNYDKFSEKINSMSPDTAADKLERLHQKMISESCCSHHEPPCSASLLASMLHVDTVCDDWLVTLVEYKRRR